MPQVVALPFPDVDAIRGFVEAQLADEEGCRLSSEERRRNVFAPGLLLLPPLHPLAAAAAAAAAGEAHGTAAAAAAGAEEEADGSSILTLVLPRQGAGGGGGGEAERQQGDGVLCVLLDLAGQDTTPFSPGLLPGAGKGLLARGSHRVAPVWAVLVCACPANLFRRAGSDAACNAGSRSLPPCVSPHPNLLPPRPALACSH